MNGQTKDKQMNITTNNSDTTAECACGWSGKSFDATHLDWMIAQHLKHNTECATKTEIKLPRTYTENAIWRMIVNPEIVATNKTKITIKVTMDDLKELHNDAKFYGDASYIVEEMGREYLGLSRSALAAFKILDAVLVGA